MTTDNRTSEPKQKKAKSKKDIGFTEAQVEAAAKALYEVRPNGGIEWDSAEFDEWMERGDYRTKARAALEAAARTAQGAAPSGDIRVLAEAEVRKSAAEGNPISEPGVTKDIAFVRGAVFAAVQGAAPQADGAHQHEWDAETTPPRMTCECAAPVLPSSGVDEDALMAELDRHNPRYDFKRQVSNYACGWKFKNHVEGAHSVHRARAVAAWLEGQGGESR